MRISSANKQRRAVNQSVSQSVSSETGKRTCGGLHLVSHWEISQLGLGGKGVLKVHTTDLDKDFTERPSNDDTTTFEIRLTKAGCGSTMFDIRIGVGPYDDRPWYGLVYSTHFCLFLNSVIVIKFTKE